MPKITVNGGPTSYLHQVLEGPAPELATAPVIVDDRPEVTPGVRETAPEVLAGLVKNEPARDYSGRTFAELRTEARERGLPSGGTRDDLIQRLTEADRS